MVRLCQVLEVSEKGYANWRKRGKSKRKQDDEWLAERIKDAYTENRGKYGSPRIHAELLAQGIQNGAKTGGTTHAGTGAECQKTQEKNANNQQQPCVSDLVKSAQAGFYC